jgi:hypothetical protein
MGDGWCRRTKNVRPAAGGWIRRPWPLLQDAPATGRYRRHRSTSRPDSVRPTSAVLVVRGRSLPPRPGTQMRMTPLVSAQGQRQAQTIHLNTHHSDLHRSPTFTKLKRSTNPRHGEPLLSIRNPEITHDIRPEPTHRQWVCLPGNTHPPRGRLRDRTPRKQPDIHESIVMNRPSRLSLLTLRQDFSNSWTSGSSSAESGYIDRGTTGAECAFRAPLYHHTAPPAYLGCLCFDFTVTTSCRLPILSQDGRGDGPCRLDERNEHPRGAVDHTWTRNLHRQCVHP